MFNNNRIHNFLLLEYAIYISKKMLQRFDQMQSKSKIDIFVLKEKI